MVLSPFEASSKATALLKMGWFDGLPPLDQHADQDPRGNCQNGADQH
jgi:hypothetical protein